MSIWDVWDSVKEGAAQIVQVYKEDLSEFTSGVASDTENVVKSLSDVAAAGLASAQTVQQEDETEKALERQRTAMEKDVGTFCTRPAEAEWGSYRAQFKVTSEAQEALRSREALRESFEKFVPVVVQEEEFWARYFFRLEALRRRVRERARLVAEASEMADQTRSLAWEDEEDLDEDQLNKTLEEWGDSEEDRAELSAAELSAAEMSIDRDLSSIDLADSPQQQLSVQNVPDEEDWAGWS